MENQTRFDLNAAIENWRAELAAQAGLTTEVLRELETHLRDSIAELRHRGLDDEESFWVARRRVGQPLQLAEEFIKVDPAIIWRERIFWMAVATLAVQLWWGLSSGLNGFIHFIGFRGSLPEWTDVYVPWWAMRLPEAFLDMLLNIAPIIWIAVLLTKGRIKWMASLLSLLLSSRRRFLFVSLGLFLIYCCWCGFALSHVAGTTPDEKLYRIRFVFQWLFAKAIWPVALVALTTWLIPNQNRKPSSRIRVH